MPPNLIKATIGLTIVALGGGTFLILRDTPSDPDRRRAEAPFTSFTSEEFAYTVTYPSDWHRAVESLTPNLGDPQEILSLATFPLVYEEGRCAQLPESTLSSMSVEQAFISLQERARDSGHPPRPLAFPDHKKMTRKLECIFHPARMDVWWIPFEDEGRDFYALIALGKDVSHKERKEVWSILNGLSFDEKSAR